MADVVLLAVPEIDLLPPERDASTFAEVLLLVEPVTERLELLSAPLVLFEALASRLVPPRLSLAEALASVVPLASIDLPATVPAAVVAVEPVTVADFWARTGVAPSATRAVVTIRNFLLILTLLGYSTPASDAGTSHGRARAGFS